MTERTAYRPAEIRKAARAICNIVSEGDCVMNERGKPPCNSQICHIYPIAKEALEKAARAIGEEPKP